MAEVRHAALMIVYNNLELTKEAVASVLTQDIGSLDLYVVDNGSTDGTWDWLQSIAKGNVGVERRTENESPCKVGNEWLGELFGRMEYEHVLCLPNDVVLPENLYSQFLRWPRGLVTGSMSPVRDFVRIAQATAVNECTPLAVVLVRRWLHAALIAKDSYFLDEKIWHYASDCDLALRIAACGIRGVQLDMQYYHVGSASHRLASQEDGDRMRKQADEDRAYFERKWGFAVADPYYGQSAADVNFRGERIDGR